MVTLIILVLLIILVMFMMEPKKKPSDYDYKCFLLTVKDQKERQERFYKSHREEIPIETIYGPDTRIVRVASEYEHLIEPEYYEKALEMHYNSEIKRPDITYFT